MAKRDAASMLESEEAAPRAEADLLPKAWPAGSRTPGTAIAGGSLFQAAIRRTGRPAGKLLCLPSAPPPAISTDAIERLIRHRSIASEAARRGTGDARDEDEASKFAAALEDASVTLSHEYGTGGVWEHADGRSGCYGGDPTVLSDGGPPKSGSWFFSQTRNARAAAGVGDSGAAAGSGLPRYRLWQDWELLCNCC